MFLDDLLGKFFKIFVMELGTSGAVALCQSLMLVLWTPNSFLTGDVHIWNNYYLGMQLAICYLGVVLDCIDC